MESALQPFGTQTQVSDRTMEMDDASSRTAVYRIVSHKSSGCC
jgi:hypothetical protein